MAGSVTQDIGMAEFKNSMRIGNQSEARNYPQRVHIILENNVIIDSIGGMDQVPLWADKSPTC